MNKIIGISVFILSIGLFSCQNEKVADIPIDDALSEKSAQITLTEVKLEAVATETEYEVEFYANAEETLTEWWKLGKAWRWSNKLRYKLNQCPLITIVQGENDGYPKTITLDYGDGTVLKNEKVLSGVIVVEISSPRKSRDYTRMVIYDNFGVDTVIINGTSLVTVDKNEETFRNFESDLAFKLDESTTIERASNRTWMWAEGMETTDDQTDDEIHIEGLVVATNSSNGDTYKKEIVDPLIRLRDCRYIVDGTVKMSLNDAVFATLDYGNGDCNAVAIMITDTETTEIDLTKFKRKQKKNQNGKN